MRHFRSLISIFALLLIFSANSLCATPANFEQAKKLARTVWNDHRETFYCGCAYDKHGVIDFNSCSYKSRDERHDRVISWEHVVPVSWYGRQLDCWNKPLCVSKKGKKFKGRKCCKKISPVFRRMEADLHNLVPVIREVNAKRENFRFAEMPLDKSKEKYYFSGCPIIIDERYRLFEPPEDKKGMVARISLYMANEYGIDLGERQFILLTDWNNRYPVSPWEKKWNHKITTITGTSNYYIDPKGKHE